MPGLTHSYALSPIYPFSEKTAAAAAVGLASPFPPRSLAAASDIAPGDSNIEFSGENFSKL